MSKKSIFLFLGLLLPVLVFLFLRFFGRNEFDVPFPHGTLIEAPAECNYQYQVPYTVPDSLIGKSIPEYPDLLVVSFSGKHQQLQQMLVESFGTEVKIARGLLGDGNDERFIKRCILLMPDNKDVVVLDKERRVRGYYDSGDRDETDRLKAELLILLKRY